ncbi:hypothetical protein MU0083_002028 [[Mycobacterium] kokjensenii]|uniref:Uncharacterized protein n=1 Tax=[Mycobacterium] kokjensenii TaxID=3064287 RepID=A0ABN9N1H2_9MYCO|nr:hypothetical protein [Mycolicibacter sp. MU0083]CAJ1498836.1 hypothetical protein MU0083_002028 [Mycolicibacter sp. MU0083]
MWDPRRLLTLLGVGAAAAVTALVLPMSAAQAAPGPIPGWGEGPFETCNGAVCMVMEPLTRESLENWSYEGIRPFITDWKGEQLYNIEYTPEGSEESTLAGSYNIQIEDFWNSFFSSSAYQFGDFVANPDLAEALDPMLLGNFGYLSGSSIYEVTIGDFTNLTMNGIGPHDMNYWVMSFGDLTYTVATDPNNFASAGYFQTGDDDPIQLWNSLWHPWAPGVPDYLIPNDPFAELDFDPADFFDSDALAWF